MYYEDAANATTDSGESDDWDEENSNEEFDPDEEAEDYEMVQDDHNMS
jgi:hypothetical protein